MGASSLSLMRSGKIDEKIFLGHNFLPTAGVPFGFVADQMMVACGQDHFAAFYCRDSGFKADFRLDAPAEQAHFVHTHWSLGLTSGVVISTPVPKAHALPRQEVDGWIDQALAEAHAQRIVGKAITPFLLARIKALSQGRSLQTNQALVLNNARVGAELAVALQGIRPRSRR